MRQKVTITLDSEIAEKLRLQSIKKYGNSRSMSRLIEDLATGAAEMEQPEACSILGHRSEYSFKKEAEFKEAVEEVRAKLKEIEVLRAICDGGPIYPLSGSDWYFVLKDACELEINRIADMINKCWSCKGLNAPVPKYPDAGRNFVIFATMDHNLR
mgnify:CR=1 FL=1